MRSTTPPSTAKAPLTIHTDLLIEMLEVCTHNVLFLRRIYPFGIFQPRQLYGCTVHRSRFPTLNEYIANALRAAQFLHHTNQLHKFEIVLSIDPSQWPRSVVSDEIIPKLESYIFDIGPPPPSASSSTGNSAGTANGTVSAKNAGGNAKRSTRSENAHAEYERLAQFEETMRALLLSLDAKCKNLRALPKQVSFSIQLHTTQSAHVRLTDDVKLQDFPWIRQEQQQEHCEQHIANVVPLADVAGVQIYAQNYD